jgi:hypothetical protein
VVVAEVAGILLVVE